MRIIFLSNHSLFPYLITTLVGGEQATRDKIINRQATYTSLRNTGEHMSDCDSRLFEIPDQILI